ncbi:ABC-three component system protein [Schinkia sp. CFF1]
MSPKMAKQKNDDTKTKLGDIYHYYVVLSYCLELQENETILVEKYGDISIESEEDSKNIEVKRHQDEHILRDRQIDFWKTVRNWVTYHQNMRDFKKLILYTTSTLGEKSKLKSWNSVRAYERLRILVEIGHEMKKAEEGLRPIYDSIFKHDVEIILTILEKVELYTNQTDIVDIEKKIMKNSFFKSVKKNDRKPFINSLMGYILTLPVNKPHKWEISCEDFESLACEVRNRFTSTSGGLRLPPNIPNTPQDEESFKKRKFVREIKEIRYDSKIPSAISNYWRAQQAIFYSSIDNPTFNVDLGEFQNDIKDSLVEFKTSFQDECDDKDPEDIIYKSKKLYDKAMEMPANGYYSVKPNRPFFQRGIIHKLVEERGFSWNVLRK